LDGDGHDEISGWVAANLGAASGIVLRPRCIEEGAEAEPPLAALAGEDTPDVTAAASSTMS